MTNNRALPSRQYKVILKRILPNPIKHAMDTLAVCNSQHFLDDEGVFFGWSRGGRDEAGSDDDVLRAVLSDDVGFVRGGGCADDYGTHVDCYLRGTLGTWAFLWGGSMYLGEDEADATCRGVDEDVVASFDLVCLHCKGDSFIIQIQPGLQHSTQVVMLTC